MIYRPMIKVAAVQHYLDLIDEKVPDFEDDGLSGGFPDWMYRRWRLSLAGRVHDWHYCTRCHPVGSMSYRYKTFADRALRQHARELLPWYLQIAPIVLYCGVWLGGGHGSWDSCGDWAGDLCRHNIAMPEWMAELRPEQW